MTREQRMNPLRCRNEIQRRHLRNIGEYGVSILSITSRDDDGPIWTYSIGFWQQYEHPEVVVVGLDRRTAGGMIDEMNDRIRDKGESFMHGTSSSELLDGDYTCYFQAIDPANYGDYFAGNRWFYDDDSYPVVQIIWPALNGTYPWQASADPAFVKLQPLWCSLPRQALQ